MKRISIWTIILLCILLPINIYALDFDIYSNNVILYNTKENKVVYEKNSKEKISIASLTKITTGIVAIENIKDLDEKITITNDDFKGLYEANAALAGFRVGEEVTYRDLLYGLMLPSGAEAARALERNVAGSEEAFIKLMNNKAKELKLENTHYANPTGLDDPNHYSTANDVLTIFKYALSNKEFKEILTTKKYTTSDKSITFRSTLSKLSGLDMDYVLGGKTGTTEDAGLCLATLANYDDTDFILVTAKAEYSRTSPRNFLDQKEIYEYVRDNYDYMEVVNKKDVLVTLPTKYLKEDEISFTSDKNVKMYLENTFNKKDLKYKYTGEKIITSKMKKNQKIGKVDIYYDKDKLTTIDIVLKEKPKFSIIKYLLAHKIIVGIILLLIIIMFIPRKKKKRKRKKIKIKVKKKRSY